jgi:starch synthase
MNTSVVHSQLPRRNVGLAAWEITGVVQAGGVGDVARDLALNLKARGHFPVCFLPFHAGVKIGNFEKVLEFDLSAKVGSEWLHGGVFKAYLPDSDIPVFLLGSNEHFFNQRLYWNGGENVKRYIYGSKILPVAIRELEKAGLIPKLDVLHVHDSPFAFAPLHIRLAAEEKQYFERMALIGTIHNGGLGYQGEADLSLFSMTGLPFDMRDILESDGEMRLIKGFGYCDGFNTVSAQYLNELQTRKFGRPLTEWYKLLALQGQFVGIPNGISGWDPRSDNNIVNLVSYEGKDITSFKAENKAKLQKRVSLPVRDDVPLFVIVSRLATQKFGLLMWQHEQSNTLLKHLVTKTNMQMVVLAQAQKGITAEEYYAGELSSLARDYSDRFAFINRFESEEKRRIYFAGADGFLMPSEFEPCGLTQLYAMKYGALPVVTRVGGLVDTVTPERGFLANGLFTTDIAEVVERATETFTDKPRLLKMRQAAMAFDSSWGPSMDQYEAMYERALARVRGGGNR